MKIKRPRKTGARIEMLPLMDVIFLLLVFFIYAMLSMTVQRGITLNLPVSAQAVEDKTAPLAISITAGGKLFIDKTSVDISALTAELQKRQRTESQPKVNLFADQSVPYQQVYRVLDQIKAAGIQHVSLQAQGE